MFIEFTTIKGDKLTFNTHHIVLITPTRKGTVLVDVNGIDWEVSEDYEGLREKLLSIQN